MIELRWLEYQSHVNEAGEHFSTPSTYRKLQYRKVTPTGWSEWQDVPTVSAARARRTD